MLPARMQCSARQYAPPKARRFSMGFNVLMTIRAPKILIIDDFLSDDVLTGLQEYAIASAASFVPTGVNEDRPFDEARPPRQSSRNIDGLGPFKQEFQSAISARQDEFMAALGVPHFTVHETELELVAHGDGAYYITHVDVLTGDYRALQTTDRIISAVFYFYRQPKAFNGGELAIYPLSKSAEPFQLIEPDRNRLIAFPSFVPHEVRPVTCSSGAFADSRFAINCWLRRARN